MRGFRYGLGLWPLAFMAGVAWELAPHIKVVVVVVVVLAVVGGMAALIIRRTTATVGTTVGEWEEHRAALYAGQVQSEVEGRPIQVIRGEIEG